MTPDADPATLPSRAGDHPELAASRRERWSHFGNWDRRFFPNVVGLELEEVRTDYSRMRLRYREELEQPARVIHGGAIATMIDTVVVPAIPTVIVPAP